MRARLAHMLALLLALGASSAIAATPYSKRDEVKQFIAELVDRHGFSRGELQFLFSRVRYQPDVIKAITPPTEPRARSWHNYRALFLTPQRTGAGARFGEQHRDALQRATELYGVPAEIIVAIIGVETAYGKNTGSYRVIDALTTLAFDYRPRAEFFRSELENFLLYARDAGIDLFKLRGSYAGAIGIPQFMPGSYRRFALDYDGDGLTDLRASPADAIGSVANFLAKHGWRRGERVLLPARVVGDAHRPLVEAGIDPKTSLADLKRYGVETRTDLALDTPVALIELETPDAPTEYRLGLRNFFALTRYNRSVMYASAVYDLAQELKSRR
jgi:membrane-bound lytic murein transglycosylase B